MHMYMCGVCIDIYKHIKYHIHRGWELRGGVQRKSCFSFLFFFSGIHRGKKGIIVKFQGDNVCEILL